MLAYYKYNIILFGVNSPSVLSLPAPHFFAIASPDKSGRGNLGWWVVAVTGRGEKIESTPFYAELWINIVGFDFHSVWKLAGKVEPPSFLFVGKGGIFFHCDICSDYTSIYSKVFIS